MTGVGRGPRARARARQAAAPPPTPLPAPPRPPPRASPRESRRARALGGWSHRVSLVRGRRRARVRGGSGWACGGRGGAPPARGGGDRAVSSARPKGGAAATARAGSACNRAAPLASFGLSAGRGRVTRAASWRRPQAQPATAMPTPTAWSSALPLLQASTGGPSASAPSVRAPSPRRPLPLRLPLPLLGTTRTRQRTRRTEPKIARQSHSRPRLRGHGRRPSLSPAVTTAIAACDVPPSGWDIRRMRSFAARIHAPRPRARSLRTSFPAPFAAPATPSP